MEKLTPQLPATSATLPSRVLGSLPRPVRNKDIMLRALAGHSPEAIAELYDLEPGTIRGILNSDLVKAEMQRLQGEMAKEIQAKVIARSHEALETVTDVMRGDVGSELRFKAATKILDFNPELQPKRGEDALGAIGAGMGEYIIRELAKRKREGGQDEIGSRNKGESETTALVSQPLLGDDSGSGPRTEQPAAYSV